MVARNTTGYNCLSPFLVNGNYTSWTSWTECSVSCGNGTKTRQRDCANPSPKYGGKDCTTLGASEEVLGCLKDPCPRKVLIIL